MSVSLTQHCALTRPHRLSATLVPLRLLIPAPKGRPHTETQRAAAIFKLLSPLFFFPFIFVMLHTPGLQNSRGCGLGVHRQPHQSCDSRAGMGMCHLVTQIGSTCPWPRARREVWHHQCLPAPLCSLAFSGDLTFPKGSAFVLAAVHILLPRSALGLRLLLSPLLLPSYHFLPTSRA